MAYARVYVNSVAKPLSSVATTMFLFIAVCLEILNINLIKICEGQLENKVNMSYSPVNRNFL